VQSSLPFPTSSRRAKPCGDLLFIPSGTRILKRKEEKDNKREVHDKERNEDRLKEWGRITNRKNNSFIYA
jgi:hypothetical protein